MSEEVAKRAIVRLGTMEIEGFMLSDGSYRMSQLQVAEAVGLSGRNVFEFLRSKAIKSLLGEGYTDSISEREEIAVSAEDQTRGQTRFRALPLMAVIAYWQWQSHRGNKAALNLCMALSLETLERRFDSAFGVNRSEQERDERLAGHIQLLETYLEESMNYENQSKFEVQYYRDWIRSIGYNPDDLPLPRDEE